LSANGFWRRCLRAEDERAAKPNTMPNEYNARPQLVAEPARTREEGKPLSDMWRKP
jgi:hypothetical protein